MARTLPNTWKRPTHDELNKLSDGDVVKRLKQVSYQKYKTIVRMNLGKLLNMNTDDFDKTSHSIEYEAKNGQMKRIQCPCRDPKRRSIATEKQSTKINRFIFHFPELINFLTLRFNIIKEGIFRISGDLFREHQLSDYIQTVKTPLCFTNNVEMSVHDCATVFKVYLLEMYEPLLTVAHYPALLEILKLILKLQEPFTDDPWPEQHIERMRINQCILEGIQLLMLLLPDENRQLVCDIVAMLHRVVDHEHYNKMSSHELAVIFAPSMICPRNIPRPAMQYISCHLAPVLEYMIDHSAEMCGVPFELMTDIRAYFDKQRKKKTKKGNDEQPPTLAP